MYSGSAKAYPHETQNPYYQPHNLGLYYYCHILLAHLTTESPEENRGPEESGGLRVYILQNKPLDGKGRYKPGELWGVRVCIRRMCGCIDGVVKRMMGENVYELCMSAYEGEKRVMCELA